MTGPGSYGRGGCGEREVARGGRAETAFPSGLPPAAPEALAASHQPGHRARATTGCGGTRPVRLRAGSGPGGRAPSRLRCRAPLPAPALGIPGRRAPLSSAPALTQRFHRRTAPLPGRQAPFAPFFARLARLPRTWCAGLARRGQGGGSGADGWDRDQAGCSSTRRPCLLSLGSRDGQVLRLIRVSFSPPDFFSEELLHLLSWAPSVHPVSLGMQTRTPPPPLMSCFLGYLHRNSDLSLHIGISVPSEDGTDTYQPSDNPSVRPHSLLSALTSSALRSSPSSS